MFTRPLSYRPAGGTSTGVDSPDIFDRNARRLRRDRAADHFADHDFLRHAMVEGLLDRLDSVTRTFTDVLELGCFDAGLPLPPGVHPVRTDPGRRFAAMNGGRQIDEDRLDFADASFDLVVSAGTLDSVGDLPGAFALIRRMLRPDGLFLAAFTGGGTLSTLRRTLIEAEGDRPAPRIHPQVDVRSAGDLLVRAGFALPVAVSETLTVRYGNIFTLFADLRGMAASNIMPGRVPLRRDTLARAAEIFAAAADPDGKTRELFDILYLTGWAPAPSQPKAARRGSATASLAGALGKTA
jgi:SAM-dependent methyltransferase